MSNKNYTLEDLIKNGLQYDSSWGIYADGRTPNANARVGQTQFEQGGILDGKQLICNGIQLNDAISRWFDGEEDWENFYIEDFIEYEL